MATNTTISHEAVLAARQGLQPVRDVGWLGGFRNMLDKELRQWWGTRTWLVQTLIWVLILNGISTITALTESGTANELLAEAVQTFLQLSIGTIAIGTVIVVQGAIVGEKEMGTAAWVLSKPASRAAFLLSKLAGYAIGFWGTAILIPSVLFVIMTQIVLREPIALGPFLAGIALVALSQLFYLALTLMLGTLFNNRGPVAGIGIAFIMTGLLLKGFIPMQMIIVTPWVLPDVASGLALQTPLPSIWFVPIVATAIWIIVMTLVALWRFGREEL